MSEQPVILTTPPVHDDGPAGADREIVGGEVSATGLKAQLTAKFRDVVDQVAVRTSMPVVVPVRQLVDAVCELLPDLPRVPDYDHVSASLQRWSETALYSPYDVPDVAPTEVSVFVRDQGDAVGMVCVEFTSPGAETTTLDFDARAIEGFFLAGLAACAFARSREA